MRKGFILALLLGFVNILYGGDYLGVMFSSAVVP